QSPAELDADITDIDLVRPFSERAYLGVVLATERTVSRIPRKHRGLGSTLLCGHALPPLRKAAEHHGSVAGPAVGNLERATLRCRPRQLHPFVRRGDFSRFHSATTDPIVLLQFDSRLLCSPLLFSSAGCSSGKAPATKAVGLKPLPQGTYGLPA